MSVDRYRLCCTLVILGIALAGATAWHLALIPSSPPVVASPTLSMSPLATDLTPMPICLKLFAELASERYYKLGSEGGQVIPPHLIPAFDLEGEMTYVESAPIFSDFNNPENAPYVWQQDYIESLMIKANSREWGDWTTYGKADALTEALKAFPVNKKDVVVYGTMKPWVEVMALAAGTPCKCCCSAETCFVACFIFSLPVDCRCIVSDNGGVLSHLIHSSQAVRYTPIYSGRKCIEWHCTQVGCSNVLFKPRTFWARALQ